MAGGVGRGRAPVDALYSATPDPPKPAIATAELGAAGLRLRQDGLLAHRALGERGLVLESPPAQYEALLVGGDASRGWARRGTTDRAAQRQNECRQHRSQSP